MIEGLHKLSIYLRNILLWISPFVIFLLGIALVIRIFGGNFDKYLELLRVLVWPTTILLALFFFRKVVTYLFFSMDEFNFFGTKGELKNITEVIDSRVEKRVKDTKDEEKRLGEIKIIATDLQQAKESSESSEKKADENLALAKKIFRDYTDLSGKHAEVTRELDNYRQKEALQETRTKEIRERIRRRLEMQTANDGLGRNDRIVSSVTDSTQENSLPKGEAKSK